MANKSRVQHLSWSERLGLIKFYRPDDDSACFTLNITPEELNVARELQESGVIAETTMDMSKFGNPFRSKVVDQTGTPVFVTKRVSTKEPQKRGRKGNKIITALKNVPTHPVDANKFAADNNISVAVLRQSKRFVSQLDPSEQSTYGTVHVRQDPTTKNLMIWRTPNVQV